MSTPADISFAHVVNPVDVPESSDLFAAQPVTFETLRRAQAAAAGEVRVSLFSAQYPEDRRIVPPWIQPLPDLERSVLDVATFHRPRKLPLLRDILDRLYEAAAADFLIYTNVDIALQPYFYTGVRALIDEGYDAFVVNRRTISTGYRFPDALPRMYAEIGERHPGYDCFVFRRELYPRFELGRACVGANWVGRVLYANLACTADRFAAFTNLHMTFHLGDARAWRTAENEPFDAFNNEELAGVLEHFDAANRSGNPGGVQTFPRVVEAMRRQYAGLPAEEVRPRPGPVARATWRMRRLSRIVRFLFR